MFYNYYIYLIFLKIVNKEPFAKSDFLRLSRL